jgi:hypothetical protein
MRRGSYENLAIGGDFFAELEGEVHFIAVNVTVTRYTTFLPSRYRWRKRGARTRQRFIRARESRLRFARCLLIASVHAWKEVEQVVRVGIDELTSCSRKHWLANAAHPPNHRKKCDDTYGLRGPAESAHIEHENGRLRA